MQTFYTTKRPVIDGKHASSEYPNITTDSSITDVSICVDPTKLPTIQTRDVIITEITDPKTFHVQDVDFNARADKLIKMCNQCAMENNAHNTDPIVVDEMYLVTETDKSKWYRGLVREQKKLVTVYLVDYGRHMKVMKNQ